MENIFSAHLKESKADLLIKYRCLKYCDVHGERVDKNGLLAHLEKFGYSKSEIKEATEQLLALPRRLLRSDDGDGFEQLQTIELNPAGKFYLDKLLFYLDYLELIAIDCYLPEELVPRLDQNSVITDRLLRTIRFIQFIGDIELEEIREGKEKIGDGFWEEYQRIYGYELLASRILRHARSSIRSIFISTPSYLPSDQSFHKVRNDIDLISMKLSQKLQDLLQKS